MLRGSWKPGLIVDHEILRQQLQHHAVFLQLDVHGAVHGAIDVALFDFAGTPEIHAAAAVGAARGEPAHAGDHGLDRRLRHRLGFFNRRQHAVRHRLLIRDAALRPALGRHRAVAEQRAAARLPAAR